LELRHLIYFREVARLEHVSAAARELHVSQPAITRQLQDLERELGGKRLFERAGRRVRLTEAGRLLLGHAELILRQVEQARFDLATFGDELGGRVSIGAPPTVGERLLPDALHDFHRDHRRLELKVHEGSTSELLRLLDQGELDMAVVTVTVAHRGLRVTPLFQEDLLVVVANEHRLAGRGEVTITDLRDEPFLLYSPGGYVRDATLNACRAAKFAPRVALNSGSMELLLRMAEAGLGVAIIPPLALKGDENLARLRLCQPVLRRTMALVSPAERALTAGAEKLRAYLSERLARPETL
jgi:DNA-binding transcriptional LysR family regulator